MKKRDYLMTLVLLSTLAFTTAMLAEEPKAVADAREKGDVCLGKGDFEGAIAAYTEAIRLDSKNAGALADRALRIP